jgi:hypothetical protein
LLVRIPVRLGVVENNGLIILPLTTHARLPNPASSLLCPCRTAAAAGDLNGIRGDFRLYLPL